MATDPDAQAAPGPADAAPVPPAAEAEATPGGGQRRTIGVVLLGIGVVVALVAAWSVLRDDGPAERRVGKLTASHIGPDAVATTAPPSDGKTTKTTQQSKTTTTADTTRTTAAPTGPEQWPGRVLGRPKAFGPPGGPPASLPSSVKDGFYLWQDYDGWHLWQVGGSSDWSAEVVLDNPIPRVDPVGGSPSIEHEGNHLTVSRGSETAEVTGVDFSSGFYGHTLVITITGDGNLRTGTYAVPAPPTLGLTRAPTGG